MSFFDSKQETINIELTSYGKMLLSKGKFKPVYYAFFDDDVIYDSSYINITESQNDIVQRIMNETPVNKPQYIFVGTDQTVGNNIELFSEYVVQETETMSIKDALKTLEQQNISEKKYALSAPLGKSSFKSEYYPAWHINLLSGAISSSNPYVDNSDGFLGSLQPYLKIPQLNLTDGIQQLLLRKDNSFQTTPEGYENVGFLIDSNGDTTSINLKIEQYLLEVMEKNVDDVKDNFDIEVFIEQSGSQSVIWKQLSFIKQPTYIKNNILLDVPEEPKNASEIYKNPNFVEHYLKILIDDEIILPPKQKIKVQAYDSKVTPDSIGDDC